VQELISILLNWINDELGDEKIRMKVIRQQAILSTDILSTNSSAL
jgi:hypothetical protein